MMFLNTGQLKIQALVPIGRLTMIDTQLIEHGRLKIVNADRVVGGVVAEVIGRPVAHPPFDSPSG